MSDDSGEPDPLGELVEDFLARRRRGEAVSIEAQAARLPGRAGEVRALLGTLVLLEDSRSQPRAEPEATPSEPGEARAATAGRRIGGYELVRELGRGGMGIVFEAHDVALGRRVAIKILPGTGVYDERARERFLREARIVARLRHPHIVPIHLVGEEDGVLYFVMELIHGTSLDQLEPGADRGGSGLARARWAARLGREAAETLAHAHRQGVLHRDVKPSNFLLDDEGKLWLADFGLAKLNSDSPLTATGEWLGTLRYMAPERLRGEASVRSDIYGLGLTLYEWLVGSPAFPEPDRARLVQLIAGTSPVPPRRLDPGVPRDLEAIVLRASARDPEDRYATAAELAEDLGRFLEGERVEARRWRRPVALRLRRVRRRPVLVAILGGLLLALVGLGVRGWVGRSNADSATPPSAAAAPPSPTVSPASPAEPSARPGGPPWGPGRRRGPAGGGRGPWGPRRGAATP